MSIKKTIKILDYKAGNAPSVLHAITHLGYTTAELARQPQDIKEATHIILPGVGSAKATMESLQDMGIIAALEDAVIKRKIPFLGICVGLQILFEHSAEENTDCLGWLKGRVVKFDTSRVRVPQMGWNKVWDNYYYFVNSYYAVPADPADLWGESDYGGVFCATVRKDNIYGTQFHIEKSGPAGLKLLNDFLNLKNEVT